jgi:hypothetical protein
MRPDAPWQGENQHDPRHRNSICFDSDKAREGGIEPEWHGNTLPMLNGSVLQRGWICYQLTCQALALISNLHPTIYVPV